MKLSLLASVIRLLVAAVLLCLSGFGCGGGSVGTGVSTERRSFEGRTIDTASHPVAGAVVTLVDTGESAITGSDGRFFLASDFEGPVAQLKVRSGSIEKTFTIPNIKSQSSGVQLNFVLDQTSLDVSVSSLEVSVQVRGSCDYYFENNRIIRQAGQLDDGTVCSLRVEIRSEGKPLEGAPFLLQRRRCLNGAPWHDEGAGLTGTSAPPDDVSGDPAAEATPAVSPAVAGGNDATGTPHPGVARLPFTFYNDEAHCVYRVLAPYLPKVDAVIYEIQTFRKQEFDRDGNGETKAAR